MFKPILVLLLILCSSFLYAQTEKAEVLKQNVVLFPDDAGFGFICGEYNNQLYIVTANHVVDKGIDNNEVILKFYDDYKKYIGKVIKSDSEDDIALIRIQKPNNFKWRQVCLGKTDQSVTGKDVAFVGKGRKWFVPYGSALGTIQSINKNYIVANITSILPGTSGGPIITKDGIIGMIVNADGVDAKAITIDFIKKKLFERAPHLFSMKRPSNRGDHIVDADGNDYATRLMKDGRRWMIQNLNLDYEDSWCIDSISRNCDTKGRLYFQKSAEIGCKSIGPDWYLPTERDWEYLIKNYTDQGYTFKANKGGDAGHDAFAKLAEAGFNLAPVGIYWHGDKSIPDEDTFFFFANNPSHAAFWSSSQAVNNPEKGIFYYFVTTGHPQGKGERLYKDDEWPVKRGHSVRCIK